MTDAEKLNIIDRIIGAAFEFEAIDPKDKSGYYEGIVCAIYGVLTAEENSNAN